MVIRGRKPGGRTPLQISVREPKAAFEDKIERIAQDRGLMVRGHANRSEVVRVLVNEELARMAERTATKVAG